MFFKFRLKALFFSAILALAPLASSAQTWNPQPNWKDSYAVNGKCYCDSNGYDHNLDSKSAETPIGIQNVVDICNEITRVLGNGPTQGRIPYNDIQCGNGPANDAADEAGCPGRVDIGPAGCNQIGPKWDLDTVYSGTPNTGDDSALDRAAWILSASNNSAQVDRMIDGAASTRWNTGTPQSPGQTISIDLSETLSFNRIELDTQGNPNDYPRSYSVFVSSNGVDWGASIITGVGLGAITTIEISPQSARFIRIDQTGSTSDYWWSIHELEIFNDEAPGLPIEQPADPIKYLSPVIHLLINDSTSSGDL